ncbi:MAG: site-specific integrase [Methanomassiliicoccus sp.]|nr:site-specific integrase [Methanomassiliicoccus sp.]
MRPSRKLALEWIEKLREQNYPETTLKTYKSEILQAIKFGESHNWPDNPKKWEASHAQEYQRHVKKYRTSTQMGYMMVMLLFLEHVGLSWPEKFRLRIKVTRSRVRWLEKEQTIAVISSCEDLWTKTLMLILIYTALRETELSELKWSEVDQDHLTVLGKGSKGRRIRLTRQFWEAIEPYMAWRRTIRNEFFMLHPARNGHPVGPYTDDGIYSAIHCHGKRIGISLDVHTFRRSCLRDLYFAGMSLPEIQRFAGHERVETTIQYLGLKDSDLDNSVDKFQPRYH